MGKCKRFKKKKSSLYLIGQSCPTLCDPMDCSPPGSSVHGDSPGKNTGVGSHALLQGSSNPRIKSRSPALQVDYLPSEPPIPLKDNWPHKAEKVEIHYGILNTCKTKMYDNSTQAEKRKSKCTVTRHLHEMESGVLLKVDVIS